MVLFRCDNSGLNINIDLDNNIVGDGGEGKIYKVQNQVAKIYNKLSPEQIEKLKVMVENPPEDPMLPKGHISIAWPQDLIKSIKTDEYVGFLMPKIQGGQTLLNVYNPERRKKNAPGFNWLYLHITAQNVATVVESIHAKKYLIGDIKSENFLVNAQGFVSIVDTDSFQIEHPTTGKIYRCLVGSEEYTPPELVGKDFKTIDRSEIHDRFGLAVIIYQLLFGAHPYQGSGDSDSLDVRISKGHWPHGPQSPVKMTKWSIPLEIIDAKLQDLFHLCFSEGHNDHQMRPTAKQWRDALGTAITKLIDCKIEIGHQYKKSYGKCYWCERKTQTHIDIFPTVPSSSKYTVAAWKSRLELHKLSDPPVEATQPTSTKAPEEVTFESRPKPVKNTQPTPIKQPVKQTSPIIFGIIVTAITLASLFGIPSVRDNVTLPILRSLTGTQK